MNIDRKVELRLSLVSNQLAGSCRSVGTFSTPHISQHEAASTATSNKLTEAARVDGPHPHRISSFPSPSHQTEERKRRFDHLC